MVLANARWAKTLGRPMGRHRALSRRSSTASQDRVWQRSQPHHDWTAAAEGSSIASAWLAGPETYAALAIEGFGFPVHTLERLRHAPVRTRVRGAEWSIFGNKAKPELNNIKAQERRLHPVNMLGAQPRRLAIIVSSAAHPCYMGRIMGHLTDTQPTLPVGRRGL